MNLMIELPEDLAMELNREAERRGLKPQDCATQIIRERLPAIERARAARALFAEWEAEDATDDPNELAARQLEWEQLKQGLNANRSSGRKLFPE